MWARRVLLATVIAAAAMSLPRHGPANWNSSFADAGMVTTSFR